MTNTAAQRELLRPILQLVGVPYKYRGRHTGEGLDCLTFCSVVYDLLGRRFPLPASYTETEIPDAAWLEWEKHWQACDAHDDWPIVDMSPTHAGVLLPGTPHRVIHCWRDAGGVVITRASVLTTIQGYWELKP